MNQPVSGHVVLKEGLRGQIVPALPQETPGENVLLQLENGRRLSIPASLLVWQSEESYTLPYSFDQLQSTAASGSASEEELLTIPLIAEELQVGKRTVETGGVRVRKTVHEQEETVDLPLLREELEIERVPINQKVEGTPPASREEGEVLIVPLFEEVLIVEKRLMLKEELHIRRKKITFHQPQQVSLRREEIEVEELSSAPLS